MPFSHGILAPYRRCMDEHTRRTPHPEEPAEGRDLDEDEYDVAREHAADDDPDADDDDPRDRDGSDPPQRDAPLGGDETTEAQLTADNEAEEDTLRTLDPDDAPA